MNAYRISHYTIRSKLGAGGMGEVYKAHDTILDRPVALKILPLELVENADRLRRFIQEAKSASGLNHPHIITIYEVGEARAELIEARPEAKNINAPTGDLVSIARETPIHFIAMEFIEGETVTARIHRDQSNLRKLPEYLVQTADGLTKAHGAGIVHRDLKPDNVMINGDGYAKILDFGLAKLVEPPPANTEQNSDEVATVILNRSQPGAVMGTIGYMSPEQALGRAVDQRSDIFAFGCILYEIVTGRKPFLQLSRFSKASVVLAGLALTAVIVSWPGAIILLVELSERVVGHGVLASIVPALLIAIATPSFLEPRWILIGLTFLISVVTCLLAIQLLSKVRFRDCVVGLLLIAGIWGYTQRRLRTTLSALAVNRE